MKGTQLDQQLENIATFLSHEQYENLKFVQALSPKEAVSLFINRDSDQPSLCQQVIGSDKKELVNYTYQLLQSWSEDPGVNESKEFKDILAAEKGQDTMFTWAFLSNNMEFADFLYERLELNSEQLVDDILVDRGMLSVLILNECYSPALEYVINKLEFNHIPDSLSELLAANDGELFRDMVKSADIKLIYKMLKVIPPNHALFFINLQYSNNGTANHWFRFFLPFRPFREGLENDNKIAMAYDFIKHILQNAAQVTDRDLMHRNIMNTLFCSYPYPDHEKNTIINLLEKNYGLDVMVPTLFGLGRFQMCCNYLKEKLQPNEIIVFLTEGQNYWSHMIDVDRQEAVAAAFDILTHLLKAPSISDSKEFTSLLEARASSAGGRSFIEWVMFLGTDEFVNFLFDKMSYELILGAFVANNYKLFNDLKESNNYRRLSLILNKLMSGDQTRLFEHASTNGQNAVIETIINELGARQARNFLNELHLSRKDEYPVSMTNLFDSIGAFDTCLIKPYSPGFLASTSVLSKILPEKLFIKGLVQKVQEFIYTPVEILRHNFNPSSIITSNNEDDNKSLKGFITQMINQNYKLFIELGGEVKEFDFGPQFIKLYFDRKISKTEVNKMLSSIVLERGCLYHSRYSLGAHQNFLVQPLTQMRASTEDDASEYDSKPIVSCAIL